MELLGLKTKGIVKRQTDLFDHKKFRNVTLTIF